MIDETDFEHSAVFRVGRVISVEGRRVRVSVDKLKNASHLLYQGGVVRNVAVGSFVKISKGFGELIAKVDGEFVQEDRSASAIYKRGVDPLARQLEVSLIGYLEGGRFERGVRELPLLDNECFILTQEEFELVHTFVEDDDVPIQIGALAMEPTQPVSIGVNAIFASHVGIFGNTGSGKSHTLAKLYHEVFERYGSIETFRRRAQFVLIDFNGEYIDRDRTGPDVRSTAIITSPENKREYALSTRKDSARLPLPIAAVSDLSFWTVLLDATEKTQAPFLARVLSSTYWEQRLADPADLLGVLGSMVLRATKSNDASLDRQTVLNLLAEVQTCLGSRPSTDLAALIEDFQQNLHYNATQRKFFWGNWSSFIDPDHARWESLTKDKVTGLSIDFSAIQPGIDLVRFKIVLQYYNDIISGFSNREHLSPLIKRLETRVTDIKKLVVACNDDGFDKPLIVVSLRDVNLAMRKVIPMLLCKHLYDQKKDLDAANQRYLNLIIDEAHNILSLESSRESEAWRDYRLETFEEIVKEGRKFGVFLTLASQRPHDISPTIISQLHNYLLHRLVNNLDIQAVEKAVAYLDRVSFESLPILPRGACVLAGVSTQVPVVVKIAELPAATAPNSRTMAVASDWLKPLNAESNPDEAIEPNDAESTEVDLEPPF
ncbi:DNA helicase HerA-like ATPase [Pseudarthrobacter sp. PvP004]|uniref:ATP-binding protein n=1 Tax=Pseudarthrobacter sp. PvP004 TaxID=2817850 RepID=UPI001AE138A0|nr:ATP-binding protein [Pseudarthrobacter sp. PvP004]MBP2266273.1 DNA helicase HerA-like ATPase [Pseudarthrobacter sp. PvP004]